MSDPHAILGVSRDASAEEIRRAYRHQARLHHPDAGGDRRAFAEILDAYELLGGKVSRRDAAVRTAPKKGEAVRPGPSPEDSRRRATSYDSGRRTHGRGSSRRHRRYSAWRIVPESYSAARFPRHSRVAAAPSRYARLISVAIWIGLLAVICLAIWRLL